MSGFFNNLGAIYEGSLQEYELKAMMMLEESMEQIERELHALLDQAEDFECLDCERLVCNCPAQYRSPSVSYSELDITYTDDSSPDISEYEILDLDLEPPPARSLPTPMWVEAGCVGQNNADNVEESDTDSEEETDTDSEEETDTDSEEESVTDSEDYTDTDTEEQTDTDSEEETNTDSEEQTDTDSEEQTDTDSEEESDSDSLEESDTDTLEESDADILGLTDAESLGQSGSDDSDEGASIIILHRPPEQWIQDLLSALSEHDS